jgi:hypothetical protein
MADSKQADNNHHGYHTPEGARVKWLLTRDIKAADIKCDMCGAQADTLHFVPYITECELVVFACPAHDPEPEGYWTTLDRWFTEADWLAHIREKQNGSMALACLYTRFHQLKRELAEREIAARTPARHVVRRRRAAK